MARLYRESDEEVSSKITVLDVIRLISGLVIINAVLSYFFTSSTMWGYDGKYVDTHYLQYAVRGSPIKVYTLESLAAEYPKSGRLLVSIDRKVFDVTANYETYDPNSITSRYGVFVGRDCTRMFVNGCLKNMQQCTWDLRNIGYDTETTNKRVQHWVTFFSSNPRYWQVGILDVGDVDDYELPEICTKGVKYPHF